MRTNGGHLVCAGILAVLARGRGGGGMTRLPLLAAAALVLVLACAGTAAGATWVVDDDGGADRMGLRTVEAAT